MDFGLNTEVIWKDKKRYWGMPISFTRYYIVRKQDSWIKLFTNIGLLSNSIEEVQMFRIFDISVYQSFADKIFGVGSIELHCNDESNTKIYIWRVKEPYKVRNMISALIEEDRQSKGFRVSELYS